MSSQKLPKVDGGKRDYSRVPTDPNARYDLKDKAAPYGGGAEIDETSRPQQNKWGGEKARQNKTNADFGA